MKALLSVAVIAAMLGGVSVQAATTKKATKKATKKLVKKPVVKKKVVAQKVISKKKAAPASPWSFGAIIENDFSGSNLVTQGFRTGSSNLYLRANYKINSETSFRVQQVFTQNYEANDETGKAERTNATVGDIYFQLAKSNLFKLGNNKVNSYVRTYLPTSINSRNVANKYMEIRGELSTTVAKAGIMELSYHAHGRYYLAEERQALQVETVEISGSKIDKLGGNDGLGKANSDFMLRNYLSANVNLSDKLYFLQQLGVQHTFMKVTSEDTTVRDGGQPNLYAYAELGYQVTPAFGMYVGAYKGQPMNQASSALFNTDDSSYQFTGVVSF